MAPVSKTGDSKDKESFQKQGFLKDNKSQQPQIVVGLLVTQSGFQLSYQVFAGNTFKGKTMLLVVEQFISEHPRVSQL